MGVRPRKRSSEKRLPRTARRLRFDGHEVDGRRRNEFDLRRRRVIPRVPAFVEVQSIGVIHHERRLFHLDSDEDSLLASGETVSAGGSGVER